MLNQEMIDGLTELARQRQEELDEQIDTWRADAGKGLRIWCGPGCGNCCTLTVNTTLLEAFAIERTLDAGMRQKVTATCDRIIAHTAASKDTRGFLTGYRKAVGPCPFLDDSGSCTIYGQRPLACRALLATRPPEWCGVNLAELPQIERDSFLAGLDRQHVAWPTHYAAAPQAMAADLERGLTFAMIRAFGFGVTGSLPLLVHFCGLSETSAALAEGINAFQAFIGEQAANHPCLIQIELP